MMNSFKQANNHLTHAQIVNEYEDKVRALERENERLKAKNEQLKKSNERENERLNAKNEQLENSNERLNMDNEQLQSKMDEVRRFANNRISSLKRSLKRDPNKIKQAQLELLLDIREELK